MSTRVKAVIIGLVVLLVAGGAYFAFANKEDLPVIGDALAPPECPLTGEEPRKEDVIDRPAVAVKIENAPIAYPLSGLEDADLVYEELVEGGVTRFMAIYHCGDTPQAGPDSERAPDRLRRSWARRRGSSPSREATRPS